MATRQGKDTAACGDSLRFAARLPPLLPMLHPLLLPLLLAQGPGLTALVNDPLSHGTVGNALLSLDEAIRVANGSLVLGLLSPAEQARFTGTGTLLEHIVIDHLVTPVITLQSPLSDVNVIPGPHYHVEITGMGMPGTPLPVIQANGQPRVFTLRTYNTMVHGLRIVGGQVAVDARMPAPPAPAVHMAHVMHCEFDGQTTAAIRAHGTGTDESMVMVTESKLVNMPVGFQIDDNTAGGMVMIEAERVHLDGVTLGCRVAENGVGASMSMFVLFRSSFVNGQTLSEKRRSPGSTTQFMYRIVHCDVHCSGDVLDIEGNAAGLTMVHHHHSDFVAGAGQMAFWVYPRTAIFDVHGSEMDFDGDVSITGNLASPRIWQQNNRYHNGTVTFDVDGALPNLLWNHYENCNFVVPLTARSPVVVRSSELINTPIDGASFLAPITLTGCLRSNSAMTGYASEMQPAPSPLLGTSDVSPGEPQVGTGVTFAADLPSGIGLFWALTQSIARPNTTQEPVRFYGDPATAVFLPAFVVFQSQITVPIPNSPSLAGLEFYVQGISLPLQGQSHVPAFHLPRGGLIWLQP